LTKGIILSGGWGTRLRPLTCTIPKTLIPIVNKPVIERQILLLKEAGVKEIVLAVSVMGDIVQNYFKDGAKLGINIEYTQEKFPRGTAGAIKLAEEYLKDDNFFMLNGDVIINFNLKEMLQEHQKNKCLGTIASKIVEDPSPYGVLIVDKNTNQLLKFLEKDEYKPHGGKIIPMPINAGVYILEPEVLLYIKANKKISIEREVFPRLAEENKLYQYPITGIWSDVGKPYDLLTANILFMKDLIRNLKTQVNNLIDNSADIHPTTKIISPCVIGENVVIGENCIIGPDVIIGDNVYIDRGAILKNCLLYESTYISKNVSIDTSIISDNCSVKKNVVLKGNNENLIILSSYVEVMDNVQLIAPQTISLTICHHEVVKESMK
jgi:NDP-sugar pyrophosphorylase family protein